LERSHTRANESSEDKAMPLGLLNFALVPTAFEKPEPLPPAKVETWFKVRSRSRTEWLEESVINANEPSEETLMSTGEEN
jgi:hypothetical protein